VNANIDDAKLLTGALTGLVSGLGDPYSTYMSAETAKQFEDEISGTFEGIGMQVGYKEKQVVVIAPLPDSPAEKAGLLASDVILSVDGKDVSAMNLDQVIGAIRGKKGTSVVIVIQRGKDQAPKTFTVTRDVITVASVTGKIETHNGRQIGVITISSFSQDTGKELRAKVNSLKASSLDGIVIDLRNNPGGYLDQAVDVTSVFVSHGVVVEEVDRNGSKKTFNVNGNAPLGTKNIVVLVNGGSASASEIVAGALQDAGRAIIVGTQSFGKGTVQNYESLPDGSSLKLTIAKWLTPKGRSISEHGITPDIVVEAPDPASASTDDPQMTKALDLLAPKS
jgi:carboxyl-terminal processing protease